MVGVDDFLVSEVFRSSRAMSRRALSLYGRMGDRYYQRPRGLLPMLISFAAWPGAFAHSCRTWLKALGLKRLSSVSTPRRQSMKTGTL